MFPLKNLARKGLTWINFDYIMARRACVVGKEV